MCRKLNHTALTLVVSLVAMATAHGNEVIWDFENGNDHWFSLWSVFPAVSWTDDPTIAGDESITGVGGHTGLPEAGVAWSIGRPDQYDGQKPAVNEGDKVKADGTMEYNQPGKNHPFTFPVNSRGQESYLNTYNLTQWGDNVHTQENDQIATSPMVVLGEGAVLTVWSQGGGSGTHAPEYDPDPAMMYTDGSSGIAILSAEEEDKWALLASLHLNGRGTLTEDTLDLSAFAGKRVLIDVVDAFEGSWGWLAIDEIRITNATCKVAGFIAQLVDNELKMGFDAAQIEHLGMLGYHVVVVPQDDVRDGVFTKADANELDVLVISESISSSRADNLRGTSAPTMHQEAYGWDNHYFAGAAQATNWYAGSDVDIVNDTHPIIVDANLSMGPMKFFDPENSWTSELVSNLAAGAEILAKITVGGNDLAIVFAIENGAELANGQPAASRIVGFSLPGLGEADGGPFGPDAMTDEAWAFYDAAIRWLGPPPVPPTAAIVNWDFENGNDHGFALWSVKPATPAPDDPNTAGDEALTGGWEVGNPNNLPEAGVAWTIGPPTMFDGLLPGADPAHARVDANGLLNYSLGTSRMTADHGFLNTYNLNLHGDFVHTQENDQIATSPIVQLFEGAILTATVAGSGADHEPILDEPGKGYTNGSGGIAVLSAEDGTLLASMETEGRGGEDPFTLDLSAFAGQKVIIEAVDAHEGGWGWMAVDEIQITNATVVPGP